MTSIRVNLDDETKTLILLSSLSATYKHLVTTLLYSKETISIEAVTTVFLLNKIRKMTRESNLQSRDTTLVVRAKKEAKTLTTGGGQNKSLFEVEWFCCHRKDHIKRNCHKLKNNMKEIKWQKEKIVAD